MKHRAYPIETPAGVFSATFSERGLSRLSFPASGRKPRAKTGDPADPRTRQWLRWTREAVERVLAGQAAGRLPPLDLTRATAFQRSVWQALQRLPPGTTRGYGEIARAIRRPGASRAVGQACGANPIPLLIPCHRVLAAGRRLGGFSGGLAWKRRLLETEGVRVAL